MTSEQREKWTKIASYPLYNFDIECDFYGHDGYENTWTEAFTHEVIEEYRKYLFILAETGTYFPAPEIIKKAWKIHQNILPEEYKNSNPTVSDHGPDHNLAY